MVSLTVKIRKSKMLYFQNEKRYGASLLLHPGVHTNSEGLAILILEFDDVMEKHSIGLINHKIPL